MRQVEKRSNPRQSLQIPLWFRPIVTGHLSPEFRSETSNVSRTGLFMRSPLPLAVGTLVAFTLRVPTAISGSPRAFLHCVGHVVHERHFSDGLLGYGVHFAQPFPTQRDSVNRIPPEHGVSESQLAAQHAF